MKLNIKKFFSNISLKKKNPFYNDYNSDSFSLKIKNFLKKISSNNFFSNSKKKLSYFRVSFYLKLRNIFSFEKLGINPPPQIIELTKKENFYNYFFGIILFIFSFFLINIPFNNLLDKKSEFKKNYMISNNTNSKINDLKIVLKEKTEESINNEIIFKQLKEVFLKKQFKDIFTLTEYIQSYINKYDLTFNTIGKPIIKTDNIILKNNNISSTQYNPNQSETFNIATTRVIINYNFVGDFDNIYNFIKDIESTPHFLKINDSSIIFRLTDNNLIQANLILEGNLSIIPNDDEIEGIQSKNIDEELKNIMFSKIENEPLRQLVSSIKIFTLNKKLYSILILKNGRKLILKNFQYFKENNQHFKISISKLNNEYYKIILENTISGETLELKQKL